MRGRLVFLVGLNTGYVTDGEPDERYLDFYANRSSDRLHCAIVGNVVMPGGHGSNASTPTLSSSPTWTRLAAGIAEKGTLPGIQLATAWEGYTGSRRFRSLEGPKVIGQARALVRDLPNHQLNALLDAFDEAADLAAGHGFRHIQVHAAHGYLMSLLLDPRISARADRALDRVSSMARRCGAEGLEMSIRISLRTGDAEFDSAGREDFLAAIAGLPFAFVDVSSGFYNVDKQLIYPARPDTLKARREETLSYATGFPERQFILSGRAMNLPVISLPENVHLGLCRDLIANPRFLTEPSVGCVNSGKCHYFSRGEDHVTCPRWTEAIGMAPGSES